MLALFEFDNDADDVLDCVLVSEADATVEFVIEIESEDV